MKYWSIVVMEESVNCDKCGRTIDSGKPAFIHMDTELTGLPQPRCNCPECIEDKYPDLASEFIDK